jgi:protein-S-isoprenylcysteine O-methyltransferase Ste14
MGRILTFLYGIICYLFFFAVFLYSIAFVGNLGVPKSIDTGYQGPLFKAVVINLVLLSLFAVQHSVMARPGFKKAWTKFIPEPIERSTYVLLSSILLAFVYWNWQTMNAIVWDVHGTILGSVLYILFWAGWALVLLSTFMINHFDLFGLRQTFLYFDKKEYTPVKFVTPFLYKYLRHPLMTGFIIAFWATPVMTSGHLLFAVVTTGYIVVGAMLEEKDLLDTLGEDYRAYRQCVGMLIPGIMKSKK